VKRGELWTAAGDKHYAGKPRPVLIVQDDRFDATDSITICPLTSDPTEIPLLRIQLDPGSTTGLTHPSSIMVDKLTTMPRSRLGEHIGQVPDTNMLALSRALVVFLGIATTP
jgi:mRNA interferase MazF